MAPTIWCSHVLTMLLHLLPCHDQGHLHTAMLRQVIDANEPDSQDSNPEGPKDFNGIFHNEMRLL